MAEQRWIPLESNPAVLNKYIQTLGADVNWQFVDIYGTEPDLLSMVPRPVIAVMLLYPLTEKAKANALGEEDKTVKSAFFMRQTISNACGTVALVHALANNEDKITFDDNAPPGAGVSEDLQPLPDNPPPEAVQHGHSTVAADKHFRAFLNATKGMSPQERSQYLEEDKGMGHVHEEFAQEGDTQAPSRDASVMPHFVAFVHNEGKLLEMDGRKEAPVCHGNTTPDALLEDTVKVVKKFMARDPQEINFNLMALAKA